MEPVKTTLQNSDKPKRIIKRYKGTKHQLHNIYNSRRGITKYEYKLIWTALWMLFIFGLCWLFGDMDAGWLLFIWGVGMF